ncbi:hypothetical protein [Mycoplasma sp. CSL7503-lung]|uniref:hypothetical protein n=1 Tax=Mycoplasma sp. CSL7503-lung TaxID=536372 RepID=UPI0021CF807A|nr:hypothetical protein [Mycoplasma sp. CSL7503-lung]MCU4706968.1 hypothetical protein [Mycoplasma sp. CSL7503-lung]
MSTRKHKEYIENVDDREIAMHKYIKLYLENNVDHTKFEVVHRNDILIKNFNEQDQEYFYQFLLNSHKEIDLCTKNSKLCPFEVSKEEFMDIDLTKYERILIKHIFELF